MKKSTQSVIKQAKSEIEAERDRQRIETAKSILLQIEHMEQMLADLRKQVRDL